MLMVEVTISENEKVMKIKYLTFYPDGIDCLLLHAYTYANETYQDIKNARRQWLLGETPKTQPHAHHAPDLS